MWLEVLPARLHVHELHCTRRGLPVRLCEPVTRAHGRADRDGGLLRNAGEGRPQDDPARGPAGAHHRRVQRRDGCDRGVGEARAGHGPAHARVDRRADQAVERRDGKGLRPAAGGAVPGAPKGAGGGGELAGCGRGGDDPGDAPQSGGLQRGPAQGRARGPPGHDGGSALRPRPGPARAVPPRGVGCGAQQHGRRGRGPEVLDARGEPDEAGLQGGGRAARAGLRRGVLPRRLVPGLPALPGRGRPQVAKPDRRRTPGCLLRPVKRNQSHAVFF
mmetsp:Transcript_25620/g.57472  ORF Transcript_25620/g.57472 Transcript_25620/m.57472 type:complete len:274 (+) Transcript_25620:171-992(+)